MSASEVVDWILLPFVAVGVVWFVGFWVYYPLKFVTWGVYSHLRYTSKGLCPKRGCHKPMLQVARLADQTYGPSTVVKSYCECGSKPFVRGNRRYADWAGF